MWTLWDPIREFKCKNTKKKKNNGGSQGSCWMKKTLLCLQLSGPLDWFAERLWKLGKDRLQQQQQLLQGLLLLQEDTEQEGHWNSRRMRKISRNGTKMWWWRGSSSSTTKSRAVTSFAHGATLSGNLSRASWTPRWGPWVLRMLTSLSLCLRNCWARRRMWKKKKKKEKKQKSHGSLQHPLRTRRRLLHGLPSREAWSWTCLLPSDLAARQSCTTVLRNGSKAIETFPWSSTSGAMWWGGNARTRLHSSGAKSFCGKKATRHLASRKELMQR